MDPNETLKRLRSWTAHRLAQADGIEVDDPAVPSDDEAAELFAALDTWLTRGGFQPKPWQPKN